MIRFEHVSKTYASGIEALDDVSFMIEDKKRTVLYGPSGSGKTTILSILAGLICPTSGRVTIERTQGVSLVFQEDRLFSHLSVFENIAFGLDHRHHAKEQIKEKVEEIARLTRTAACLDQKASTLSGGQKQRVAIARALVSHPGILLMDEAFSHLDQALKKTMIFDLIEWTEKLGTTLVWVSHDFQETLLMAEQMIVLEEGKIVQQGTPYEISLHPDSAEVASSISLLGVNSWKGRAVPIEDCRFHGGKEDLLLSGWQEKLHIPYKDGYLYIGELEGTTFCVFSEKETADTARIYIKKTGTA